MSAIYHLYIDIVGHRLVTGLDSSAGQSLRLFAQNDTPTLALHALEPDLDPASLSYWREVPFPFSTIKAGISKAVDAPPASGTFKVRLVGQTQKSAAISYATTKAAFATILNAMSTVAALGGVTVDLNGASNLFIVKWVNAAETTLFEIVDNRLSPKCFGRVYPSAGDEGFFQIIKVFVAPFAFTDSFTVETAPELIIAEVRPGTTSQNAVQSVRIPNGGRGQAALVWGGLSSALVPVVGLTAAVLSAALNGIVADGTKRFLVSQPAQNLLNVEFIGPLAKTTQDLLTSYNYDQDAVFAPTGDLALTSTALEVIQDTAASFPAVLEIAGFDGGKKEVLVHETITVINDMLDSDMALDIPGWLESATEAAAVEDPTVPIISGTLSWSVRFGDGTARVYTFAHGIATLYPVIEVYVISPYRRLPDNEYETEIVDSGHVKLTFALPVETDSLRVAIVNVEAQTVLNAHHHSIEEVDGLQTALDTINGLFTTFSISSPLPISMIPLLPWDKIGYPNPDSTSPVVIPDSLLPSNIPRLDVNGYLPLVTIPPEVPRLDVNGNLVVGQRGTDGAVTLHTILNIESGALGQDLIDRLIVDLSRNANFAAAMLSAIALSGTQLPEGVIPMQIPDLDFAYPPQRTMPAGALNPPATVYADLPRAVVRPTDLGTSLSGMLPVPDGTAKQGQVDGTATSPRANGVRGEVFVDGDTVVCDGRLWWKSGVLESPFRDKYYPAVLDCDVIAPILVYGDDFPVSSLFSLSFVLQTQLLGNVVGTAHLILEVGNIVEELDHIPANITGSISSVEWTKVFTKDVRLSAPLMLRQFGYKVSRAAGGTITATSNINGVEHTGAVAPPDSNFAVRARLVHVDLASDPARPRGQLIVRCVGPRAGITPL